MFSVCGRTSPGPVLPGPGAVPLQRRQHDGLPAAEHRQPGSGVGGGALGHGAAAGPRQGGERHDGGHDDGEWALMVRSGHVGRGTDSHPRLPVFNGWVSKFKINSSVGVLLCRLIYTLIY